MKELLKLIEKDLIVIETIKFKSNIHRLTDKEYAESLIYKLQEKENVKTVTLDKSDIGYTTIEIKFKN